jgi:hypothetical protein
MKEKSQKRIDRKHRFTLRIDEAAHKDAETLAFRQHITLNVFYIEAIQWARQHTAFVDFLRAKFPVDERRGHFIYIEDASRRTR